MHSFQDNEGRNWEISITVHDIKRTRQIFSTPDEPFELVSEDIFLKLAEDPVLLADLLWELVNHSKQEGVTAEDFGRALGGDAIEAAGDAISLEIINFFPKGRRDLYLSLFKKIRQTQAAILKKTTAQIMAMSCDGAMSFPELLD